MESPQQAAWIESIIPAPQATDSPLVRLVTIGSLNGVAALQGRSGALGSSSDQEVLAACRSWADAVLVTAHTAHVEEYGFPKTNSERRTTGRPDAPCLVLVSGSLELDLQDAIFQTTDLQPDGHARVYVASTAAAFAANPELVSELNARNIGILHCAASKSTEPDPGKLPPVDIANLQTKLHGLGLSRLAIEGGPQLYAASIAAHIVDEVIYTVAPHVVFPATPQVFPDVSDLADTHLQLALRGSHCAGSHIFTRYAVRYTA